jgi:hypothetical protein
LFTLLLLLLLLAAEDEVSIGFGLLLAAFGGSTRFFGLFFDFDPINHFPVVESVATLFIKIIKPEIVTASFWFEVSPISSKYIPFFSECCSWLIHFAVFLKRSKSK